MAENNQGASQGGVARAAPPFARSAAFLTGARGFLGLTLRETADLLRVSRANASHYSRQTATLPPFWTKTLWAVSRALIEARDERDLSVRVDEIVGPLDDKQRVVLGALTNQWRAYQVLKTKTPPL